MNLPNYITLTRIASIPVFMWVLTSRRFTGVNGERELLASAVFILASLTDVVDGYLARKRGQITALGMLLDPVADKLMVAAAFVTLVQFNPHVVPAWMVVIIIGREFLVSGLRSIAASQGFAIEASDLGKFKTFAQIFCVVAAIIDHRWWEWPLLGGWFLPVDLIAHAVIEAALDNREVDATPPSDHLAEPRGAFTTLHLKGELRGCVGYVIPVHALYRTVAETAAAAAFHDTRFPPVSKQEAPHLAIEISVLSPLQPIEPDDIEIGRHGLVITFGSRRGLLLPQVSVEYGWDVKTFLQQTCHKAGLPPDAWERGATIEGFTAEIFGDKDFRH